MMLSLVCFMSQGQPDSGFLRAAISSVKGVRLGIFYPAVWSVCFTRHWVFR